MGGTSCHVGELSWGDVTKGESSNEASSLEDNLSVGLIVLLPWAAVVSSWGGNSPRALD